MPDFAACANTFLNAPPGLYANYTYNGTVRGIFASGDRPALITLEGCYDLCGSGSQYYTWDVISQTISTWVLPVLGMLLQAPYESNKFRATLLYICRFMGSPVASLTYILWNIKVTKKCALMIDMSVPSNEIPRDTNEDGEQSQFSQIRDSFYILAVMNQFSVKPDMPSVEGEKLLRIALFSTSLQLLEVEDEAKTLVRRRQKLAKTLREGRSKGIIPVYISLGWFLFSLACALQASFGDLGSNTTAHNLALGLLWGWLPVLILSSIVDRNPSDTESTQNKLNRLLGAVRRALLNPELRHTYIKGIGRDEHDFEWTKHLDNEEYFQDEFFIGFAGQSRKRWHYGVAEPILAGIEDSAIGHYGRDWLQDPVQARHSLVRGPPTLLGLTYFDYREAWQISASFVTFALCVIGAFLLSWYTPTVGLGCRTLGYLVYGSVATGAFIIELLVWQLPESHKTIDDLITRVSVRLHRHVSCSTNGLSQTAFPHVNRLHAYWSSLPTRQRIELLVLRPLEIFNTVWSCYIVMAQTIGSYDNCICQTSIYGGGGGYMDFEDYAYYRANGVLFYWAIGTGLSCFAMCAGIAYVITEWATQSHMNSENYEKAMRGLKRVRRWKKFTYYFRKGVEDYVELGKWVWRRLAGKKMRQGNKGRRSMLWTNSCRTRGSMDMKFDPGFDSAARRVRKNDDEERVLEKLSIPMSTEQETKKSYSTVDDISQPSP